MPNTEYPTAAHDAECALLGGLMLDNGRFGEVAAIVRAGDFQEPRHRLIFGAIRALIEGGLAADNLTVSERLGERLGDAGGAEYIGGLYFGTPSAANVETYASLIRSASERREVEAILAGAASLEPGADAAAWAAERLGAVLERREGWKAWRSPPKARAANAINDPLPAAILRAKGRPGAALSEGTACLLSGEGGIGKSALLLHLALKLAAAESGQWTDAGAGLEGLAGPALFAAYEDAPGVLSWKLRKLARELDAQAGGSESHKAALARVHVLDLAGWPMFGPPAGMAGNQRPGPLAGWRHLWTAATAIRPRIVIIDPALAAFVGEANAQAPVREFLSALAVEAGALNAGVMVAAHSTKAARAKPPDRFDAGKVGGAAAWTDGCRGALILDWIPGGEPGDRELRIAKANYGPARILCPLEPVREFDSHESGRGAILGFEAGPKGWRKPGSPADSESYAPGELAE